MEKSCFIRTSFDESRTRFPGGKDTAGKGGRIAENDRDFGNLGVQGISENWKYFILTNQGKYAIIHADISA